MSGNEPWSQLTFETRANGVDPTKLHLLGIEGGAEVSLPYRYELHLEHEEGLGLAPDVLDDMLRQPCVARWGPSAESAIHGVLESIVTESVDVSPTHVRYRAVLVPRLARLAHAVRSRVFQDLDVAGIAASILEEHGMVDGSDFEILLASRYPASEYTLQYEESDLAFLSRQLEHHGIHFHFVQDPDRERLVIGDANRALSRRMTTLDYEPRDPGGLTWDEAMHTLERRVAVGSASVLMTEYNWRTPQVILTSQHPADAIAGYHLAQEHGAHFKTPAQGAELSRVRAEQIVSERVRYTGRVTAYELFAGDALAVVNHPLGDYNREYVVVSSALSVRAGSAAAHEQTLTLAELDVPYRPPRRTPKPRIHGFVYGRIDGPAHSTAAPIDDDGRYKVLLPFDLNGQPGGKASRWVRVAQPASGPGYGVHLPMHLGAEVAIAHVGGDPDRPVIIGSLHNADSTNPVTASNATQSWIRTQAGVRVLFDDDA